MVEVKTNGLGVIKVENNKVFVLNPEEGKLPARILPSPDVEIKIDNKVIIEPVEVFQENVVEFTIKNQEKPKRHLNIEISEDKIEAKVTIREEKCNLYKIKDSQISPILRPTIEVIGELTAPRYTESELTMELNKLGIIYGLDDDAIKYCCENDIIENISIAMGKEPIKPIDDEIKAYFNVMDEKKLVEDDNGRVDFKSIGEVETVKSGDLIGELQIGENGKIGFNVYGQVIKPPKRKVKTIKSGKGVNVVGNRAYATISGKPYLRSNTFSVEEVFNVDGDVDISKGNIRFIGDVIVHGNVKDDMKVESGNSIIIRGNVLRGELNAEGDIEVKGNIISSNILGGNIGADYSKYIEQVEKIHEKIFNLCENLYKINSSNNLANQIKEKDLINAIIDARFKNFNMDIYNLINSMKSQKDIQCDLYKFISVKMCNCYFDNFKTINEVTYMEKLLKAKIEELNSKIYKRCDMYITYAQDCNIDVTGNIYIDGKGIYKSNVSSLDSIYFINDKSTIRGGVISAENEIKAKIVGTPNGVMNVLKVKDKGHIYVAMAYYNTKFIIGNKKYVLEEPSKDIHVYLDKDDEICVEKLKL
ncbi:FapA family protein [Clostridium senegalense]